MSQSDFGIINPTTKSGATLATDLNGFRDALHSTHKGPVAPSYAVAGLHWIDDTTDPIWLEKVYDGANWAVVCVIDTTNDVSYPLTTSRKLSFPLAGGLGNALTLTPDVPLAAYVDGDVATWTAAYDNTAAAVLDVSGVGDKAIRKMVAGADVALDAKDMRAGRPYTAVYKAAANSAAGAWILVNPSSLDTWSEQAAISIAAKLDTADLPAQSSVAKAWALVKSDGTIAKSFNVTSVTKNSTGRWTVALGVTMDSINYAVETGIINANGRFAMTGSYTTTGFDLATTNNSDVYADPNYFSFAVFGELA